MSRLGPDLTLEQIDDWFKIGKKSARPKVQTVARTKFGGRWFDPKTGGADLRKEEELMSSSHRRKAPDPRFQRNYADYYKQLENEAQVAEAPVASKPVVGALDSLELDTITSGTAPSPEDYNIDKSNHVYRNYDFTPKDHGKGLPIAKFRDQIVGTIESNQVTVIQGSTGSGKTTQVPQYILDQYALQDKYCNIIVTQPRRIAAMSIARRVCQERGWNLGGVCGYQVGMNRENSEDTRLLYVTTGVLLQKLINTKHMFDYTHVILDEVHERDQDTDFSLLVVRKLLRTNSHQVKVVLMSATFDSELFAQYFSVPIRGHLEQAPVVSVEGKCYSVSEYYIEDLKPLGPLPVLDPNNPGLQPEAAELAKLLTMKFDDMELQEQGPHPQHQFAPKRGTVLVFLPGLAEIENLDNCLSEVKMKHKLCVIPLHSSITKEEQARVFIPPQLGQRKVILSTNIAESSITVPDIKYVIDFCLTRNLVCDPETNYTSLQVDWASKANCTQRKGRAGRVSNGRVYRMVTRQFWGRYLPEYGTPEMQRCPLEQLILRVKLLDLGEPKAILGLALSPPNLDDIERTILLLKEVGALASLKSGAVNPHDGDLTFIGRVLAKLPVDVRIGKLLVLGHVFGVLEECLTIGAALSLQSFHSRPYKLQFDAFRHKMAWARGTYSDCFAALHAYQVWQDVKQRFMSQRDEEKWCRSSFIQLKRIREVEFLRKDLVDRLGHLNIKTPRRPPNYRHYLSYEKLELVLKMVLAGAFYPNYFVQGETDEEVAARAMSGKNAFTTVMVKNLPANQGVLYKTAVEGLFKKCGSTPVAHFEETRAYIEFRQTSREVKEGENKDSLILQAVYMAIKMRHLREDLQVAQLDPEEARLKLEQLAITQENQSRASQRLRTNRIKAVSDLEHERSVSGFRQVDLPKTHTCSLFVSVVLDCGHFWAQYSDDTTWDGLQRLGHTIAVLTEEGYLQVPQGELSVGTICLAPYCEEGDGDMVYYRARVEEVTAQRQAGRQFVQVFFVDFGNYEEVERSQILNIDLDEQTTRRILQRHRGLDLSVLRIPFQAFECFLAGIKPSSAKCPSGQWSAEAKRFFANEVREKHLWAQVYSVIHGTVRVELTYQHPVALRVVNINQFLKDKEFADVAEESFASKQNHMMREEELKNPHLYTVHQDWLEVRAEEVKPNRRGPKINLHGPFSPLEMTFYSMTNMGRMRAARVFVDSVNSVALNDEPQNPHARLMVAAHVKLNPSRNTMVAENTTIMPYIPGLPAITAMLFAPTVELRTDKARTHYIGALCGLGWDPETHYSALPEHDLEITFDTKLEGEEDKNEIIARINGVRMIVNIALDTQEGNIDWTDELMLKIQREAQTKLLELLLARRESVTPQNFNRPYRWNQIESDYILSHKLEDTPADSQRLLNLINAVFLNKTERELNEDEIREKKRLHREELHRIVQNNRIMEDIQCMLCKVTLRDVAELKLHLTTQGHRRQELIIL